jgi:hypothetical protein
MCSVLALKTEEAENKYNLDYCSGHSASAINIPRISNEGIYIKREFY